MPDSPEEAQTVVTIILLIVSLISVLSTTFVSIAFFKYESLRDLEFRFIFYVCFSDLMFTLIIFLGCIIQLTSIKSLPMMECYFEGSIINFFATQEIFWSLAICYTLKQNILYGRLCTQYQHNLWVGLLITISAYISLLQFYVFFLSIRPVLNKSLYFTQPLIKSNCFVKTTTETNDQQKERGFKMITQENYRLFWTAFGMFYIPLWASFIYNIISIVQVVKKLNKSNPDPNYKSQINSLFWYPGSFIFCWFWIFLDRLLYFCGYDESIVMGYVDYIFLSCNGTINSAIYAYTQIVNRTTIRQDLKFFFSITSDTTLGTDFDEQGQGDTEIQIYNKNEAPYEQLK